MKTIKLPCGSEAFVSDEDWERVKDISWSDDGKGYVRGRWKKSLGGDGKIVKLHRFIINPPDSSPIDHIDGNPLNNTRGNLQIITTSRNIMKSKRAKRSGVTFDKNSGYWRARIRFDGNMVDLGCFNTWDEARAQVKEARRLIWEDPELNENGYKT